MAVQLQETNGGNLLEVRISGKLVAEDYNELVPKFEALIQQHGKISLLLEMRDFHGWDAGGLWQDLKFDVKHFNDIEYLAMVGDKKWEKWMAQFCRPFTSARIRYFDIHEAEQARQWLHEAHQ